MKAMAGVSMPCCSDGLRLCSHDRRVSFLSPPCFRSTSSRLLRISRPLICPRSFFQEESDKLSATNSFQGQPNRKPFESSKAPNPHKEYPIPLSQNREGTHNEEEERSSSHTRDELSSKGDDGHELKEDTIVADDARELEDGYRMTRVSDRLIEVFLIEKTTSEEWRKLLAFSKEWPNIRAHFFKRCGARAEQELDPERKGNLLKLLRKLKEVDDDMERHNELLAYVKENLENIDIVVARRRKDFTNDFFQHLELLYQASYEEPEHQHDLARVGENSAAAVEAHDKSSEEEAAISAAQMKFDDILNSPSLDVACNKIDDLAKRNQLDSTMMLLITKAWAASKESTMMKEEVKDILHHLYMIARGNMQRLVPKEVRIMRHVLSLEDPNEQFAALTEAFSPGAELEGKDIDFLYTTPEKLHNWIVVVLDAYYNNQRSSLMKAAQELMSPATIKRLEILKHTIQDQFL
eukprot:c14943_g1_i1 orf=610-2004(-)